MNDNNIPSDIELLAQYPKQEDGLKRLFRQIEERPLEDQVITRKALVRYLQEAANESYHTEPGALIQLIRDQDLLKDSEELIDLGAGPGQLLEELALLCPKIQMRGIDLSPGFVDNCNRRTNLSNVKMDVGLIDRRMSDVDPRNRTSAISVLTLDRIVYPKMLIENMAKFHQARILATLLPVVPEDDNPSRQGEGSKIVYTRAVHRIVPGQNASQDREVLQKLLKQEWKKSVDFAETNYVVSSSGDRQVYQLGVFYTS